MQPKINYEIDSTNNLKNQKMIILFPQKSDYNLKERCLYKKLNKFNCLRLKSATSFEKKFIFKS
jgi:hypothetical protein